MHLYIDQAFDVADLEAIASDLGIQLYDVRNDYGVISRGKRKGKRHLKFVLRPISEDFRLIREDLYTASGRRRVWAVCWHGHWHFMRRVFDLDPNAQIRSAVDVWDGLEDFETRADSSAYRNIGSQVYPSYYSESCDCTGTLREQFMLATTTR